MREDEDHIRRYMPAVRRIIIVVAVLTAVPVVMWTVTAFMRTNFGPPKLPKFQAVAISAAATSQDADSSSTASVQEAKGPPLVIADSANLPGGSSPTSETTGAPYSVAALTPVASGRGAPPDAGEQVAAQSTVTNWPDVSTVRAAEPLAGPIPLPRKRPRSVTMASADPSVRISSGASASGGGTATGGASVNGGARAGAPVPLPRPRPEAAGPPAPESSPRAFNWLHSVFQPSPAAATPPAADYDTTPH